jgi:hypothetical protein
LLLQLLSLLLLQLLSLLLLQLLFFLSFPKEICCRPRQYEPSHESHVRNQAHVPTLPTPSVPSS